MDYQLRRPVIKAVEYTTAEAALEFVSSRIPASAGFNRMTEIIGLIGPPSLRIDLERRDGCAAIDLKRGDFLVYTDECGLHAVPRAEFNKLYEPADVPVRCQLDRDLKGAVTTARRDIELLGLILAEIQRLQADLARYRTYDRTLPVGGFLFKA